MPYGGSTKEEDKKIESCVLKVQGTPNKQTGKPFTKSEAIAVCKSQIMKKGKKNSEDMDLITLSLPVAQKMELVDDSNADFSLMKFELIDDNEYNGIVFDADAIKYQYELFKQNQPTIVVPHGMDHSRKTLEQLGSIHDMELVEKDGKTRCNIISKIFKQTQAQKEARILFEQGLLNYISGGWSGRIVFDEEKMKFLLQKPRLREVSSTPTPAKDDAKLLEVLNSLRPEQTPETESVEMDPKNETQPPTEGQTKEQGAEVSALLEQQKKTAQDVAELKAVQEKTARDGLLKRAGELGLSVELFKDRSLSEIEFALKVGNEAVVVALRGKTPTTQLGGESQTPTGADPETVKELIKTYYNW